MDTVIEALKERQSQLDKDIEQLEGEIRSRQMMLTALQVEVFNLKAKREENAAAIEKLSRG